MDRRALHSATVTHGCHSSSYQKKILESRLAEADGLSFPSFLRASIPLETVTGTRLLPAEPLQGDPRNPERSAAANREGRPENTEDMRTIDVNSPGCQVSRLRPAHPAR